MAPVALLAEADALAAQPPPWWRVDRRLLCLALEVTAARIVGGVQACGVGRVRGGGVCVWRVSMTVTI